MSTEIDTNQIVYLEGDCVVTHQGKEFAAGGAFVSPTHLIGYLAKNGILTNWHGAQIGTYRITSSWPIQSAISTMMHQVEARIGRTIYTGRSCGIGMIYRGKSKATNPQ